MAVLMEDPTDPGTYLIQNLDTTETPLNPPDEYTPSYMVWNSVGDRYFETGVDRGVLYLDGIAGVPWNGMVGMSESPNGGEATPYYIDGIKYSNQSSPEEFEGTLEAFTYPEEFALCDGTAYMAIGLFITQQKRRSFGFSYRTRIGNDVDGTDRGYKIHIVYNAMANPSEKDYTSISDEVEPTTFSWDISTTPVKFEDAAFGVKYGSHLILDSRIVYPWAMRAVEAVLYGDNDNYGRLPSPREILDLFINNALLQITDNHDGTWTATGPDEAITLLNDGVFEIDWPSAVMIDADTYVISSL